MRRTPSLSPGRRVCPHSESKAGIKKTLPLNGKLVFKDKDASSDSVIAVKGHGPIDVAVHLKLKAYTADGKDLLGVIYLCFDELLELENFLGGVLYSCENHNLIGLFKTDAKRRLVANAIAEPRWQMGLDNKGSESDSDNEQDETESGDSFHIDILGTLSAGVSGVGSGLKNVSMFAQRRIGSMGIMHANKDFQKVTHSAHSCYHTCNQSCIVNRLPYSQNMLSCELLSLVSFSYSPSGPFVQIPSTNKT